MLQPQANEIQNNVDQLREDATQTARDIIEGVQVNYVHQDEFRNFVVDFNNQMAELAHLVNRLMNDRESDDEENHSLLHDFERMATPRPQEAARDNVRYDNDHDVIMRNNYDAPIKQVPDPGIFTGDTNETDLFCQLCEDTFKTQPNNALPEEAKINFVKSRLRDAARNWYLTKYKDDILPITMQELLNGLRVAFSNVASYKIAKIKIMRLRQTYGKVNDYINEFRALSQQFRWNEEALTLIFYNGLHQKYQEEIEKMEVFPVTLESIITKCILFESSISTKHKINQSSNSRSKKNRHPNNQHSFNNRNRYSNNNYHKYNNNNYSNNNNNDHNNNNNNNNYKAQKITSKN